MRPLPGAPLPPVSVVSAPLPVPAASSAAGEPIPATISGNATWYRWKAGQAAAGPGLRKALGKGWRGSVVRQKCFVWTFGSGWPPRARSAEPRWRLPAYPAGSRTGIGEAHERISWCGCRCRSRRSRHHERDAGDIPQRARAVAAHRGLRDTRRRRARELGCLEQCRHRPRRAVRAQLYAGAG